MSQPSIEEIWAKQGLFIDTDTGEAIEQPEGGFPIAAGAWPTKLIGSMQVRCSICNGFAGISQKGYALHKESPAMRPVLCPRCFAELVETARIIGRRA
jgi:hypothetical protein